MFSVRPMCIFPDMTISGKKDELLEVKQTEKSRTITFIARVNSFDNGVFESYQFIVYDENVDKTMKMKLRTGSKVHIVSEIQSYLQDGRVKINFKVKDIGFSEAAAMKKKEKGGSNSSTVAQSESKIDMNKARIDLDEDFDLFNAQLPEDYTP